MNISAMPAGPIKKPDRALNAWSKALNLNPKNKALQKKVDDASHAGRPPARIRASFSKSSEGNFRQISDLHGLVQVEGRWKKTRVKTQGGVYYLKPDRLLLAVGTPPAPVAKVSVKGQEIQIQPPQVGDQWSGTGLEGLTWLPTYFSGKLLASLYESSTVTQDKKQLHYAAVSEEAWVDPGRGVLLRYIRKNPQGGQEVLTITAYDLVEGLWLPRDIHISNDQQGWQAALHFSDWQINEPQTAHVFDTLEQP